MYRDYKKRIIKDTCGCDFVIELPAERKNTKIKLLQLTDMQVIDSSQRRTPDRLGYDEINAWTPKNFDAQCGNHIKSLVAQTNPDIIFITGDIIYGSFDDSGTTFEWFLRLMDSFEIPWAPVFGNHDNETKMGVLWQCLQFEKSEYCVFKRGNVSGNSNYTVGISAGGELVRVLYMLDSNGCGASEDPNVIKKYGIFADQLELMKSSAKNIKEAFGKAVPAFCAFHVPTNDFVEAELGAGYAANADECYTIGVDKISKNGDFGTKAEKYEHSLCKVEGDFAAVLKECNVEAVFAGHYHDMNTCILHNGIRWVFGLKTGQYDYHIPGSVGGTLVCLEGNRFDVHHIPSLVPYAPFPGSAKMFDGFFAEDKYIL